MTSATSVHFTGEGTPPAPTSSQQPSTFAKNALKYGLAALHSDIRDLDSVTGIANKFIQQFFTFKSKLKSFEKFNDKNYVPISCRVKIELIGSSCIRKTEKFKELEEKTKTDISTFQNLMRDNMKSSLTLELDAIKKELMTKAVTFGDMLMKHQLLSRNACREHDRSTSLTIRAFQAQDGTKVEEVKVLLFDSTSEEIHHSL